MNTTGKGGFGDHPQHINKKGRPKNFEGLRRLAIQLAHEEVNVLDPEGRPTGNIMSVVEAILRQWAQSKNALLQQKFIEVAYGKVPDEQHVTGSLGVTSRVDDKQFEQALSSLAAALGKVVPDSDQPTGSKLDPAE